MTKETGVRFLLDEDNKAANFVYPPPNAGAPEAQNATVAVKVAQNVRILDEWAYFGEPNGHALCLDLSIPSYMEREAWAVYFGELSAYS